MTYEPQGARAWPESLPTAGLQVYDSRRQMIGAGQKRFCGSEVALHCLEGQVALLHHVMALEEANSGRHAAVEGAVCSVLPQCQHREQLRGRAAARPDVEVLDREVWIVGVAEPLAARVGDGVAEPGVAQQLHAREALPQPQPSQAPRTPTPLHLDVGGAVILIELWTMRSELFENDAVSNRDVETSSSSDSRPIG